MIIIIAGSALLIFTYFIDGVIYRPILTKPLEEMTTDKLVYHKGENIYVTGVYCLGRELDKPVTKTWAFVNTLLYSLPEKSSYQHLSKGCTTLTVFATVVPQNLPVGKFYLDGTISYQVNKVRTTTASRKTNKFEVIK